jgi:hypothetical protein
MLGPVSEAKTPWHRVELVGRWREEARARVVFKGHVVGPVWDLLEVGVLGASIVWSGGPRQ